MIFVFLGCLLTAFVFSGIESGVVAVNRIRLRHRAMQGLPDALALDRVLERPGRLMATVVLVTSCARIGALSLLFEMFSGAAGPAWAAFALLLCLPAFAFCFEFVPKALFRKFPYRKLVMFGRLLVWTDRLVSPIAAVVERVAGRLWQVAGTRGTRRLAGIGEIRRAVNEASHREFLTPLQKHFLHSILNARALKAADLCAPAEQIPTLRPEEPVEAILALSRKTGAGQLPVMGEGGEVLGVVRVFDLLLEGEQSGTARSRARQAVEMPPETPLLAALGRMRAARSPLAVVRTPGIPPSFLPSEAIVARLLLGSSQPKLGQERGDR